MSTPAAQTALTPENIYGMLRKGSRVLPELANIEDKGKNTPLHLAAENLDFLAIRELLAAGAEPSATNNEGITPLHWTAYLEGAEGAGAEAHLLGIGTTQALLNAGAKLNVTDNEGNTPLHLAALNKYVPVIPSLLAAGADLHPRNNEGETPLHVAADAENIQAILKFLVAGADPREGNLARARAQNAFSDKVHQILNAHEASMLTKPQEHAHLNFNGFPQQDVHEVEKSLVTLATHYANHPEKEKKLASLRLDGELLTETGVATLSSIISANNDQTHLNLTYQTFTPEMVDTIAPLIKAGQLKKLMLLDPALSEETLRALDAVCSEADKDGKTLPCVFLRGNNPALFNVLHSQLRYMTTRTMPDGSLRKPIPSLRETLISMVKPLINRGLFAQTPQAAVESMSDRNESPVTLPDPKRQRTGP